MNFSIPPLARHHQLAAILYGALLLFWLTPEDHTIWLVSLLGAGLSLLIVCLGLFYWWGGRSIPAQLWLPSTIIIGVLVGCGAVWTTVGLMIFKNAWHSHAYPDFANDILIGVLRRLIAWSVAGGFGGAALGLWQWGRLNDRHRNG